MDGNGKGGMKMTAAEFAEEVLNIELLPYQKEFMNTAYEVAKENKSLVYIPPRGGWRLRLTYLQALAFIMAGQDKGVVKKEIIRND